MTRSALRATHQLKSRLTKGEKKKGGGGGGGGGG